MTDTTGPRGTLSAAIEFVPPIHSAFRLGSHEPFLNLGFADIDGDGDQDAFLGDVTGKISVFLNTGNTGNPAFAMSISNPYGIDAANPDVFGYASPSLVDIDGDGDLDLFVGRQSDYLSVYVNTGSASSPAFADPIAGLYGLGTVGIHASPDFSDIDGDGDLDLFVGQGDGNLLLFLNSGSASTPAFAASLTNPYGLSNVGGYAKARLLDIDGDGDLDAFIGNSAGNTLLFLNSGSASSPAFAAPITNPHGLGNVGEFASPAFVDIDGDGDLDAFVGGYSEYVTDFDEWSYPVGDIWFFQNRGSFVAPLGSSTSNGIYKPGSVITLTVAFNENVLVDTTGGIPTLKLETGAIDRVATYTAGSGTSTLTFSYTVQAGDYSADLDIASSSALSLNGATLKDAAGNHANLRLAEPGASGSLAAQAALVIDGVAPTVPWPVRPVFTSQSQNYGLGNSVLTDPYSDTATFVAIADIDGDGDPDLFLGNSFGQVSVFLNTGSASSPAFSAAVIGLYGLHDVGSEATPSLADIDGDGDLDAFVGNSDGNVLFFLNSGSASSPAFAAPLTNPYGLSDVGVAAVPSLADIDGDGDLDAFVVNRDGNTQVFLNTGSASRPAFAAALTNPYGLSNVGGSATASFVDIDSDGDLDVFYGGGQLFLNTGSASNPAFAQPAISPFVLRSANYKSNAILADIDGDGDLDAFVGGYYRAAERDDFGNTLFVSQIWGFLNTGTHLTPLASSTPNGTYGTGSVITLTVLFDEMVIVNTTGGTPTLKLETGAVDRFAIYSGGSGTNTLTFTYTVQAGDASADLDIFSSAALALNGGTIRDAAGNNAGLQLGAPGSGASLAANTALVIVPGLITIGTSSSETINGSIYSDTLSGAGGNDTLYGLDGNDVLQGGEGNDRLYGDAGNDTMTGGNGDDAYYVDSLGDVVIESSAVPATGGIDTVYSYLGSYTLISNIERGVIRVDAGASLKGNALDNSLYCAIGDDSLYGLGGNDTLLGDDGNDRLDGGEGSDSLNGGNGEDILTGGTGLDTLAGGNGNDAYYVDDAGDVVIESSASQATGGIDTVYSYLSSYTLGKNVERGVIKTNTRASLYGNTLDNGLYGSTEADTLYGLSGNDLLQGGDGNDRLYGDAGKDTMAGGNGDDAYYVDSVGDVVIESSANQATGGIDTVYSYLGGYTLGNNIERGVIRSITAASLSGNTLDNTLYGAVGEDRLYGLNGNDTLLGDDGNDRLDGGAGNDSLNGGNGDDILTGGTGLDTLAGGNGNDAYHVDNAGDVVIESSASQATGGIDTVYSYISSYTLGKNVERGVVKLGTAASLSGNALDNSLYGSLGDDTLLGGAGADTLSGGDGNDTLDGGTGKDTMAGGNGNDLYYIDNAGDVVSESNANPASGGVDTVYSFVSNYTLSSNVEDGVIMTSAAGRLSGNGLDNNLYGGVGNDTLIGGAGNDSLTGEAGGDQLTGGLGADTFIFGSGSGRDVVKDFNLAQGDRISLQSDLNGSGITSAASALAHVSDVGGNAVLNLGGGNMAILVGIHTADLTVDDFTVF